MVVEAELEGEQDVPAHLNAAPQLGLVARGAALGAAHMGRREGGGRRVGNGRFGGKPDPYGPKLRGSSLFGTKEDKTANIRK